MVGALFGLNLVELYGPPPPNGQGIWVNPAEVVTVREPLRKDGFADGTRCVVTLANGNLVASIEPCDTVLKRLR